MKNIKKRYMLINYVQKPKYPRRTHEKGYWSNPNNIQWDELVEFATKLRRNDMNSYSIIMDIDDGIVVKNSMNGEKDFSAIYGYYREHYGNQIDNYLKSTNHLISVQSAPTA